MHQKKDVAESCLKTLTAIYMLNKPSIGGNNRRDAPLCLEVNIELTPDVHTSPSEYGISSHMNLRKDRLE
jgi:hypothetical protein